MPPISLSDCGKVRDLHFCADFVVDPGDLGTFQVDLSWEARLPDPRVNPSLAAPGEPVWLARHEVFPLQSQRIYIPYPFLGSRLCLEDEFLIIK